MNQEDQIMEDAAKNQPSLTPQEQRAMRLQQLEKQKA